MQLKSDQKFAPYFQKKRAQLREKIEKNKKNKAAHAQLSNLIKNVYYVYIFINLYSLLTLYTSSDEQLIKASSNITIPILNSQVPFPFFLVSGVTIIMTLFVYLVLRFEELERIQTAEKIPYIFNSDLRSTRQISTFITYILGPLTVILFVEKAYIFTSLDRFSAILVFFIFISVLSYRRRSRHIRTLTAVSSIFAILFVYLMIFPTAVRLIDTRTDLVGVNLNGVQLQNYRLSNALFNHTKLTETTILDTSMNNITMWGSNFEKASIYNTTFSNSMADYTKFNSSIIRDVTFKNVSLKQSQFNEAVLFNVTFTNTKDNQDKSSHQRYAMDLSNSEFSKTIMVSVSFDNAILSNARFYATDLESVSFKNAILTRTNFSTAVNLSCESLQQARITESILLPLYLHKCKLGPKA